MSQLSIRESFVLRAPPERVWETLLDPRRVVLCFPGASLEGAEDERTFRGSLRVSVGPVTVTYRGTIVFEEVDHAGWRLRLSGRGREATGSGSATMTMESRVSRSEGGGAQVTVQSEVQVTGKLVSLGRGMIERVSAEVLRDFSARLETALEEPRAPEGVAAEPPDRAAGATPDPARTTPPAPSSLSGLRLLWRATLRWLCERLGRRRA